ncbi:homeobox-leucine zipper protein HOX11-like isoform X1 [Musa acuminata AAA Group]|uniref:homeobox-leucine zipper protein HOX11-like isoform X1 n=1 Tax=Musa acuminata AAA Group TaxID=214697 RepID=UPI0031D6637A
MEQGLALGMGLDVGRREEEEEEAASGDEEEGGKEDGEVRRSLQPALPLKLLPLLPVPRQPSPPLLRFPSSTATRNLDASTRGFDVPSTEEAEEAAAVSSSSPNSTISFRMGFSAQRSSAERGGVVERASSIVSDEEENGLAKKKLRLSKEQSAFLEESFKEHNTLNPVKDLRTTKITTFDVMIEYIYIYILDYLFQKQKLALAKQLNLQPRQVEVWFQNRRARTKLKQTEVDCEYLKRCCQTLTEENRRLQKEVAELRALKTTHPFHMHLPATTLSMCPSCERVASTAADHRPSSFAALFSKPTPAAPRQPP